ncbi:MFS transporter [Gryllotalpicola reticulitermitis]|uniref:MFS transporter n=1 Tax=Gryllotalpicola reticulitermitis TaxID=1184153 RepID=A0ABV8Q0J5_9MICO
MTTSSEVPRSPQMAASSFRGAPSELAGPKVWLLSVGHAVDDLYQGAVPALIPFFVAARHWDYSTASGITVAATVLSALIQPAFGVITDRRRLPWLVPLGMALAGIGIALSGLSGSYAITLLAVALSGVGVAAYHPESARLARDAARGSHVAMSWFSLGGNIGFALGPLLVPLVLIPLGISGTLPLAVPAIIWALVTAGALRRRITPPTNSTQTGATTTASAQPAALAKKDDWKGFGTLVVPVIARSILTAGFGTFLALFVEHRLHTGTNVGEAALITFYGVGAVGTLLGGRLAKRFGRIPTIRAAYAATILFTLGVWLIPGPAVFLAIAATAVAAYVPFSIHVTLGQDFLPNHVGTASGVTLGLAVSVGGLLAPVLGVIADHAGLSMSIATLVLMPVVAALVGLRLHEPN